MHWFQKKKEEVRQKWQFFVVSHKNQGYRINEMCEPIWETPKNLSKYFLGTHQQAMVKAKEMSEKWREKFGHYPLDLRVQRYVHIPDFESNEAGPRAA